MGLTQPKNCLLRPNERAGFDSGDNEGRKKTALLGAETVQVTHSTSET
jgi:hypothetical protein